MPRRPRLELANGIHHVTQRGNARQTIFVDDSDCRLFLRLLGCAVKQRSWHLLSYCLMGNHYHLVIETPQPNLGLGMRDLNSRYAQCFNERHETSSSHVYQGRYKSKLVRTDEQFAQLLRYVARNPVASGLCPRPDDWRWSSHAALMMQRGHPLLDIERVNEHLEVWGGQAASRYSRLFDGEGPLRHIDPDLSPWELRATLDEILRGDELPAAVRRAKRHGYRLRDVAAHLGISESTLSRRVRKRDLR